MATGNYGTKRLADVGVEDMEIFYTYSPDYVTKSNTLIQLEASDVVEELSSPSDSSVTFGGVYNLNLNTTVFNQVGIYNLVIRPKRIPIRITDCGTLSSNSDVRGVIFDLQNVPAEDVYRFENSGLSGYRIEYLDPNPNLSQRKIRNLFRVITSNNRCEPISENLTNSTQKGIRYRLNDSSSLVFCTVTPSDSPIVKQNASLFIGLPNQEVYLIPTHFDPVFIPFEIVEHDFDTLAIGLFGNQSKSVSDGIRTYYNQDGEIYKQFDEYTIKEEETTEALFDIKEERRNIDFSKDFDNIT